MTSGTPAAPVVGADPPPWRGLAVAAAILVVQLILIDRIVGDELLTMIASVIGQRIFRKDFCTTAIAMGVVMLGFVRRQPDVYRAARLSPARLTAQAAVFLAVFGFLGAARAGLPQPVLGVRATEVLAVVSAVGWGASLLLLLPGGASPMARAAAFAGGLTLAGVCVTRDFWRLTGDTTMDLVGWMLARSTTGPVIRPEPFTIGTPDFAVRVSYGCSGVQGVVLVSLFLAAYLWWFRRMHRFPQSLLLVPIGIGLMFLANAVRITALILVGIWISPTIAVDGFHSYAGWIAFLAVGFGTIWASSRSSFFMADDVAPARDDIATPVDSPAASPIVGPSVTACLAPFLALLTTTLLTRAFSTHDSIDVLYPLRVLVVGAVLWGFRHEFRWREASLSPVAVGLGGIVCAVWMLLVPGNADPAAVASQDPARLGPIWGPIWLVLRVVGYTVTVPIAEELAFRGFLARRLISVDVERVPPGTFSWVSFLGSSLAFGAMHQAAWIPATLAGLAFAAALYHRRRLVDAIVAHATTNALLSVFVIATGSWNQWG